MIPFVRNDRLWQNGLGGAIPAAAAMALAAVFLFAATRAIFGTAAAGWTALLVFLLNPNTLYLGSIPMSEPFFYASLFALLHFTVRFAETNGWLVLTAAGAAGCAATLSRYEGWFLLPFAAGFVFVASRNKQLGRALVFSVI